MKKYFVKNDYFILLILLGVICAIAFVGCPLVSNMGGTGMAGKTYSQMSPMGKAAYLYSVYNSQYSDYMTTIGYTLDSNRQWVKTFSPTLTDEQKEMLMRKRFILGKVYPLIKVYCAKIMQSSDGIMGSHKVEQEILALLNQL